LYIVTYSIKLENLNNYEIRISPPKEMEELFSRAKRVSERRYQLKYYGNHEIICPEYIFTDCENIIVIPYFLNPGRRYPIQVYIYASSLYSSNTEIGQRDASEATRVAFGLKTFSHSTLCRTFKELEKSFEKSLKDHFGERFEWDKESGFRYNDVISEIEALTNKSENSPDANIEQRHPNVSNHFPTAKDTIDRRCKMTWFLHGFHRYIMKGNVDIIGCKFVKAWYDKHRRLLI